MSRIWCLSLLLAGCTERALGIPVDVPPVADVPPVDCSAATDADSCQALSGCRLSSCLPCNVLTNSPCVTVAEVEVCDNDCPPPECDELLDLATCNARSDCMPEINGDPSLPAFIRCTDLGPIGYKPPPPFVPPSTCQSTLDCNDVNSITYDVCVGPYVYCSTDCNFTIVALRTGHCVATTDVTPCAPPLVGDSGAGDCHLPPPATTCKADQCPKGCVYGISDYSQTCFCPACP